MIVITHYQRLLDYIVPTRCTCCRTAASCAPAVANSPSSWKKRATAGSVTAARFITNRPQRSRPVERSIDTWVRPNSGHARRRLPGAGPAWLARSASTPSNALPTKAGRRAAIRAGSTPRWPSWSSRNSPRHSRWTATAPARCRAARDEAGHWLVFVGGACGKPRGHRPPLPPSGGPGADLAEALERIQRISKRPSATPPMATARPRSTRPWPPMAPSSASPRRRAGCAAAPGLHRRRKRSEPSPAPPRGARQQAPKPPSSSTTSVAARAASLTTAVTRISAEADARITHPLQQEAEQAIHLAHRLGAGARRGVRLALTVLRRRLARNDIRTRSTARAAKPRSTASTTPTAAAMSTTTPASTMLARLATVASSIAACSMASRAASYRPGGGGQGCPAHRCDATLRQPAAVALGRGRCPTGAGDLRRRREMCPRRHRLARSTRTPCSTCNRAASTKSTPPAAPPCLRRRGARTHRAHAASLARPRLRLDGARRAANCLRNCYECPCRSRPCRPGTSRAAARRSRSSRGRCMAPSGLSRQWRHHAEARRGDRGRARFYRDSNATSTAGALASHTPPTSTRDAAKRCSASSTPTRPTRSCSTRGTTEAINPWPRAGAPPSSWRRDPRHDAGAPLQHRALAAALRADRRVLRWHRSAMRASSNSRPSRRCSAHAPDWSPSPMYRTRWAR